MRTRRPVELRAAVILRRCHLALAAALLPLASCTYLQRRLDDLGDCFLYRFHQEALGFAVEGKVSIVEASLGGWYADWGWGKDTWWQVPGHVMTTHGTGIPITTIGPIAYGQSWTRVLATSTDGNPPGAPDAYDDVRSWLFLSDVFDFDDERRFQLTPGQRISDAFGIELGIAPVICSVRIGFNVAEFADLLLGFVFLDVFADDGWRRPPTLPYVPPSSKQPAKAP